MLNLCNFQLIKISTGRGRAGAGEADPGTRSPIAGERHHLPRGGALALGAPQGGLRPLLVGRDVKHARHM